MNVPVKLGGFAAALAAVLGISFGIGNAVGPIGLSEQGGHGAGGEHASHGGDEADAGQPGGLMVSEHGYTLRPESELLDSGRTAVRFQVIGPDGDPVTDVEPTHDAELHFFAVKRDLTGFQHLHPTMDSSGTWSIDVELTAGDWRWLADFQPAEHGEAMTLGTDVSVAGDYRPKPLPEVDTTAEVGDYTVELDGDLAPGESSELTLTVYRDGKPVQDLEPYLGAYGHLVALRAGDLAYLHVHPEGEPGDGTESGPDIRFHATAPSAGAYRLFLDFKHDGVVRTAEFTVRPGADGQQHTEDDESGDADDHGDHGDHDH